MNNFWNFLFHKQWCIFRSDPLFYINANWNSLILLSVIYKNTLVLHSLKILYLFYIYVWVCFGGVYTLRFGYKHNIVFRISLEWVSLRIFCNGLISCVFWLLSLCQTRNIYACFWVSMLMFDHKLNIMNLFTKYLINIILLFSF